MNHRKFNVVEYVMVSAFLVVSVVGCGGSKNKAAEAEDHTEAKADMASKSGHGHGHSQDAHAEPGKEEANASAKADEAPIDEKKLQVQYAEAAKTEITADNAEKFAADLEKQLDAELAN